MVKIESKVKKRGQIHAIAIPTFDPVHLIYELSFYP
jgi:hypothetical protein